ncbi:PAS domain-containing protein [Piscinibacter sakaiensis]
MPVARTLDGVMRHVGAADRERLRAALGRCVSTGLPLDVEFALHRPDGSELWLHVLGEIDERGAQGRRLVAAVQDVGERRAAEAAAREHQARLEAAVTAAHMGTYDHDLRSGRALWLGRHEAMWGYADGQYDGSVAMFLQRVHPDDRARVSAANEDSRRAGRPLHIEYRVQWPDGRVRWVVDSGNVVRDDDGVPVRFVGVVLDVTEVKEAEQHLAAMSRRISGILESTSDGFVSVGRDWRVTYANRRGAEVLGHTPDGMLGRTLRELFPESAGSDFDLAVRRAMREREETHLESYYPPWGRWYENHVFPSDEGLAVYFRDITPRKQAEAAIAALVERLQALREMDRALLQAGSIADVAQLGLARLRGLLACERASYLTTTPDGGAVRCLWSDGGGEAVFPPGTDVPAGDLGRGFIEGLARQGRLSIDDLDRVEQPSPLLLRAASAGVRSLLVLPLKDGQRVVGAALMAAPRAGHFDAGRVAIAEGIVDRLNIAVEQLALRQRLDRHAAELERRVAERTAEVVQANRELEAFSYSVSHDLRAPLQSVSGFSQALLSRHAAQLEPKARHYLERILAGAQQMEQLIADLLALAQVSHAEMRARPVDLVPIARDLLQALRDQAPAREVEVVLPATLVVHGDRALLRVLLDNLLGNAWKFSAPAARPRIELGAEPAAEGGDPVFYVADNGAGFDPAQAAGLFTPFRRLHSHSEFPGTGIGLATVQRIVARHGGRVWAESTPGVRTVLRVALARRTLDEAATEST